MPAKPRDPVRWVYQPIVFLLVLTPFAVLLLRTFEIGGASLGANPIEELMDECGQWGLRLLLATLAVSPLRTLTRRRSLIRFRRMLGLAAFFYLSLHFLVYLLIDQRLALRAIFEDIAERPFITIGFTTLLLLIPLAVTSTRGWMRRLGSRWQQLHRLVYPAAVLGLWHYWWQVKQDIREPLLYALVLAVLLTWRLQRRWRRRRSAGAPGGHTSRRVIDQIS